MRACVCTYTFTHGKAYSEPLVHRPCCVSGFYHVEARECVCGILFVSGVSFLAGRWSLTILKHRLTAASPLLQRLHLLNGTLTAYCLGAKICLANNQSSVLRLKRLNLRCVRLHLNIGQQHSPSFGEEFFFRFSDSRGFRRYKCANIYLLIYTIDTKRILSYIRYLKAAKPS